MKDYQQHLALLDEDVAPIEAKLLGQTVKPLESQPISVSQPQPDPATYFEFEVITVDATGKEKKRSKGRAEYFIEDLGDGVVLEMVKIPAGEFWMGTAKEERDTLIQEYTRHGVERKDAEKWIFREMPQHRVVVPEFWMGKFAVTQAQWSRVAQLPKVKLDLNPDPAEFKGANRPVERVSWNEAMEFCDRLNRFVEARHFRKTGKPYRLPNEAEWEYACRAGTTTPFHFGETITTDLVNCRGNYPFGSAPKGEFRAQTTDVGSFLANAFGLFDMHGNVWEWCADHWHENYQGAPIDGSAWLSENQKADRLMRGGSWFRYPRLCRSACRGYDTPGLQYGILGFRVVCGLV
ncbi:MAG TPA: formylglycine-generating enzyme family protein [Allocoleopsis sp.]